MSWGIIFTQTAISNLQSIFDYIALDLQSPENAMRTMSGIMKGVESLVNMPSRNPLYDKDPWRSMGMRKLIIKKYIVLYSTNKDASEIAILNILYGSRDIDKILSET